jgi:hypothetical protein
VCLLYNCLPLSEHFGEEWLILSSRFLHNQVYGAGFIFRISQYNQGRLVATSQT